MRRRVATSALAAGCAWALGWSASASAHVYWANEASGSLGRATLAGTQVDQRFVTGATAPRGVAVDGGYVYWADGTGGGSIGRARRDGARPDPRFVATGATPRGVAVDQAGVYWTQSVFGSGSVGRARLDGTGATSRFLPTRPEPCGVAVDFDHVYWANGGGGATIGRSHGRFDPDQGFVRRAGDPCGVAATSTHVYWADRARNAIGRVRLNGTGVERRFIAAPSPCGVAANATHVFWSSPTTGAIGRARRSGRSVDTTFVTGANRPCGVAVDPTVRALPRLERFARTRVGRRGPIASLELANTSSSPLAVRRIRIVGPHRRDFVETGDSCTVNVVPAGGACLFNVRFDPKAPGVRRALVRVASNADNSVTVALRGVGLPVRGG